MPTLGEFIARARKYGFRKRVVTLEGGPRGWDKIVYLWRDAGHGRDPVSAARDSWRGLRSIFASRWPSPIYGPGYSRHGSALPQREHDRAERLRGAYFFFFFLVAFFFNRSPPSGTISTAPAVGMLERAGRRVKGKIHYSGGSLGADPPRCRGGCPWQYR